MVEFKAPFSLKTGVQFIGLFDALLALLLTLGQFHIWMYSAFHHLPEVSAEPEKLHQLYLGKYFSLMSIILTLTHLMLGTALCANDSKSKWFVLPWLLQNSIILSVFTIFVVIKGFSVLMIHHEAIKAVYAIFIPLAIVIRLYQVLVVYTFYKTFQDDRQTDGHFTAATATALDEVLVLEEKPSKKFREPVLKSI